MTRPCMPSGPIPALVMIVGEAPGFEEEMQGIPFVGASGHCLNKMLEDAHISRGSAFITNVCRTRPPANDITRWIVGKTKNTPADYLPLHDRYVHPDVHAGYTKLLEEIELVNPSIIICLGNTSLWALTGLSSILKWRGSMLTYKNRRLLPTLHPAAVLRQWELRPVVVQDLRRAAFHVDREWPVAEWEVTVAPTLDQTIEVLNGLLRLADQSTPLKLAVDIETSSYNIACLGIAWTVRDAICIPFMTKRSRTGYWSESEESMIVYLLYRLLTHPNVLCIFQNGLYDCQYIYRSWKFIPRNIRDTMLTHHVCFPGMPKALDFICSFHNEQYVYWKDDGKTLGDDGDEIKHWRYNGEDCVRTYEADTSLQSVVEKLGIRSPHDFQMRSFRPVLKMMIRGVRLDRERQKTLQKELKQHEKELFKWIEKAVGYPLNPKSPKQMAAFFYGELALPKKYPKKSKSANPAPTCNSEALEALSKRQPLIRPLVSKIEELRSVGVFASNFLADKLDTDGRMRCSYNIAGTKTFRFSSSENAFGSGGNLANIPKGDE